MTYSITGIASLGTVTSEESTKDAQLFQTPIPVSDSSAAIMLDLFGASRTITIKGRYTESDGDVAIFIFNIDSLVNGNQGVRIYHSDKSNSDYNVLIQSVNWSGEEAGVNFVDYTISMVEGSSQ